MSGDLFSVHQDNLKKARSRAEEAAFDRKVEKHFQSHPELQSGRDYRMQTFNCITQEERNKYRKNFDAIFPDAPGAGL